MEPLSIEDSSYTLVESHSEDMLGLRRFLRKLSHKETVFKIFLVLLLFLLAGIWFRITTNSKNSLYKQENQTRSDNVIDAELMLPGSTLRQELEYSHVQRIKKNVELDAVLEYFHGTEVIWQIPAKASGVLFIAHGCKYGPTAFWDENKKCPKCEGRPEARNLTLSALRKGFAVIAIKSKDRCWTPTWPPESSSDVSTVQEILENWTSQHVLAHKVKFNSLAVYISSGVKAAFSKNVSNGEKYPPTLFLHMPKDKRMAIQVDLSMKILKKRGVQTAQLLLKEIPLYKTYFSSRIIGLNDSISQQIFEILNSGGFLDEQRLLKEHPRSSNWRKALLAFDSLRNSEGKLMWDKHIYDELSLAYGVHELSSLKSSETFDWFRNRCWLGDRYRRTRCKYTSS